MNASTYEFMSYAPPRMGVQEVHRAGVGNATASERGWLALNKSIRIALSTAALTQLGVAGAYALPLAEVAPVVRHDAHAQALSALLLEILSYQRLPHDWDGYDGLPAGERSTLDALEFLTRLPAGLQLPKPMLTGTGTVGLYWDRRDYYASIDFEGNGTYSFLTDSPSGYDGAESVPSRSLHVQLWQYLAALPDAE